jgi:hypothetical protein
VVVQNQGYNLRVIIPLTVEAGRKPMMEKRTGYPGNKKGEDAIVLALEEVYTSSLSRIV